MPPTPTSSLAAEGGPRGSFVTANRHLNRVQVVPLTTATGRVYPSEAVVRVGGRRHKAMADQIATAAKHRLNRRLGKLSGPDMDAVEHALRVQLGMT